MALTISPTPWVLGFHSRMILANQAQKLVLLGGVNATSNAQAIITAVNNTYGQSINPAVAPEMRTSLQFAAQIIWNYKYAEAINNGNSDAAAKNYANTHPDYLKVKNTLTKAATL
jgi:hypothetical protein